MFQKIKKSACDLRQVCLIMQRRLGSGRTLFLVSVLTYNADHRQDRTELTEVGTGRYYVWLVITENVKCL